jgi:hypothetical protein
MRECWGQRALQRSAAPLCSWESALDRTSPRLAARRMCGFVVVTGVDDDLT